MRVRALVTAMVVGCVVTAPTAGAERPPEPDAARLPAAMPPAPLGATEQRSDCAETFPDEHDTSGPPLDFRSVWDLTTGEGQTVAVIDTGVAVHPRLERLRGGGDYVSQSDGTRDCDAHGTLVAGIIAGAPSPDDGFAGAAPGSTILSIRQSSAAFTNSGSGSEAVENSPGVGTVETLARAIRHAADSGASVINVSEVACAASIKDASLGAAVEYAAITKDVVIVTAAGNTDACRVPESGQDSWDTATMQVSPAWYDDHVLTVGSVSAAGEPSKFTVPGPWVDVAAPGELVVSLDPRSDGLTDAFVGADGQRIPINGTSFAAPLAAGTAALIRARFPELRAREVIRLIESTAHAPAGGWNSTVGFGVIDPYAAVTAVDPVHVAARHKPQSGEQPRKALPLPTATEESSNSGRLLAIGGSSAVLGLLGLGFLVAPRRRS